MTQQIKAAGAPKQLYPRWPVDTECVKRVIGDRLCTGNLNAQLGHLRQVADTLKSFVDVKEFTAIADSLDHAVCPQVCSPPQLAVFALGLLDAALHKVRCTGFLHRALAWLQSVAADTFSLQHAAVLAQQLKQHPVVVVPFLRAQHTALLKFERQPDARWRIVILNPGSNSENHLRGNGDHICWRALWHSLRWDGKIPTAFVVGNVSPARLTLETLQKLFYPQTVAERLQPVSDTQHAAIWKALYWQWAAPLGQVMPPDRRSVYQAPQIAPNCTYKSITSLVAHSGAPARRRREFKTRLYQFLLQNYEEGGQWEPVYLNKLKLKLKHSEEKLSRLSHSPLSISLLPNFFRARGYTFLQRPK
jgi:hypothetical protein